MTGGPMGDGTLQVALDALDRIEAQYAECGSEPPYADLAVARRVLRMQGLLLARASGALKAGPHVTPTRLEIIKDIAAMLPELKDTSTPFVADLDEERPVPGPTPNNPEDKIRG